MFRSRYPVVLTLALACAGLAGGQDSSTHAASNYQDRVGKVITVQEASRQADRCQILQAWELADGNIAMQTRSVQSGLAVTVIEQVRSTAGDRFLVYRWTVDGLPPTGCPMPPGASSIVITKGYPTEVTQPAPMIKPQAPVMQATAPAVIQRAPVVQAQATQPVIPITPFKPVMPPVVQSKPQVVQEQPRMVLQAPAPTVQTQAAPTITQTQAVPTPVKKAEPPRMIVESKPSEIKPLPVPVKPQHAMTSPVQAASATAATTSPVVIPTRPITTEMPRVIVQGQPEVIKPMPTPASPATQGAVHVMPADAAGCVGHLINVTEKGKAPDQCIVLELICQPDGSQMMKVQSLCTGELMTIVCTDCKHPVKSIFDRFRFAKRKGCDVCCEPCPPSAVPVIPAAPKVATKYEIRKSEPTPPVVQKPKVEVKLPEIKKEEPKVVFKPKEAPKLPTVNPKDLVAKPAPPAPTKIVDARPIERAVEKGIMVPVPLVPLATCEDKPNVPPPQPVLRPFETRESKAVASYEAEPKAPMIPPSAAHMPKTPAVIQAANKASGQPFNAYQPRAPICDGGVCGPVGTTGWTTGPLRPVTEVPPAIQGVVRASHEQDATSAQNTVYLMTVLQSSGTPAQREWAAQKLCVCDPRTTPYVVEALMTAAKGDQAALVRVACIQSLVKLQAKNAPVLGMLQQAKFDKDPRVADEAVVALTVLSDVKSEVKQADLKVKK